MTVRIRNRRDTAAHWTANNPILGQGEIGLETDTLKFKWGDGATAWNSLGYSIQGVTAHSALTGLGADDHTQYLNNARGDARYQPLDSDLTAIAALSPINDNIVQVKAGAYAARTPAQFKTDLALVNSDVGLGSVTNDAQLKASDLDVDGTMAANSATKIPAQSAVVTYVASRIAATDAMLFKGVIDCSANPNYPAADAGATYKVSVAGKIGGASGINVEIGDLLLCTADGTASGNQATVGASWDVVQTNIDGAVVGPASSVSGQLASFNGTGGKLIQDSGMSVDTDGTLAANSDTRFATQKAVKTYAQPKDTELTQIAGLTFTNDDFVQYKSGALANRTIRQVRDDLMLSVSPRADLKFGVKSRQNFDIENAATNTSPAVTAQMQVTPIILEAGDVITALTFMNNGAATTPTHQIAALYDSTGALLRQSTDLTSTAWGASTGRRFALTSNYTVPTTGIYYVMLHVGATTGPTMYGGAAGSAWAGLRSNVYTNMAQMGRSGALVSTGTAPATLAAASSTNSFTMWCLAEMV